jgi:RecJ-like exonuclease
MMQKIEPLVRQARKAGEKISGCRGPIRVVSHYDADGISSAAIMTGALMRVRKVFHLTMVNKMSDALLSSLSSEKSGLIIFLDMGSGNLDMIKKHLPSAEIIIIDHHQQEGSLEGGKILQVNPMDFGIEENISGSGVSYIVARSLAADNRDLSSIAIVGAIGDSQLGSIGEGWGLMGINREILKDAIDTGKIKVIRGLRIWGRYTRPIHKALEFSVDPMIDSTRFATRALPLGGRPGPG